MTCSPFNPSLKLMLHPQHLSAFARKDWTAPPVLVEISPTNHCPAKCEWCFYAGGHTKDHLPVESLLAALDDMAAMGVESVSWTGGGDPSFHPQIDTAIEHAAALGIKQGMFTNGYRPVKRPELLQWVRLTITDLVRVPKSATYYASRTKTGVNVNIAPENEQHLWRLVNEARDAGVHYFQVRPALARSWKNQPHVVCPEWVKDYETETFRVVLTEYKFADHQKPHGYPVCHGHRFAPFLWHDGSLTVCAYHFGKDEFTFGNILQGGFRGVWEGERRRKMIEAGVGVIDECQNCCKNHEINKPLAMIAGDVEGPDDVEFL